MSKLVQVILAEREGFEISIRVESLESALLFGSAQLNT